MPVAEQAAAAAGAAVEVAAEGPVVEVGVAERVPAGCPSEHKPPDASEDYNQEPSSPDCFRFR